MKTLAKPAIALVRRVSPLLAQCLREHVALPIDAGLARAQHAAYVRALEGEGITVEWVNEVDAHPDGCFVEDTAVVTGEHAVLTIPGAPSRQGEGIDVLPGLARHCEVVRMAGDARLDGGDVLRVNDTLFVGLSRRTNAEGAAFLHGVAALDGVSVRTVPLAAGLHLKSVCSLVDETTIACAPTMGHEVRDALRSSGCVLLPAPEEVGANVLCLGSCVLVSASAPLTADILRAQGHRVVAVDVSELHKADGALTCLSIRIPQKGRWSA